MHEAVGVFAGDLDLGHVDVDLGLGLGRALGDHLLGFALGSLTAHLGLGLGEEATEHDLLAAQAGAPELKVDKVVVSEAGASVYSASEFASQEMPDVDVSLRGAASIARRLQDPLAELVKIDPKSIQSWEEKNAFLKVAGGFIERFDPEIKALATDALDKNKNGIPDFLEIALAKIAPQTAMIAAPAEAQGFASRPLVVEPRRVVKARVSDATVEALAQKFARQSKSAVKQ